MNPLAQHLAKLPADLVGVLQDEFQKLHQQYFLGRWEPSQLDAGRFAEIVLRILEYKDSGIYTPIGTQLKRLSIVAAIQKNKKIEESLSFHVLGLAELILDFRNKRNVAHPGQIDVNEMDSAFVLSSVNWILAELVRIETKMNPAEAQAEIKKIIERKVPIIEEIGGRLKCLNPDLDAKQKTLVFCYQKYPTRISLDDLCDWTEYSNKGVLRNHLNVLNREGKIDFRDGQACLTKLGILWVEKNIPFEIEV
jgi:hypothetical protein